MASDTLPQVRLLPSAPPDPARHERQLGAIMDVAWAVSSTLNLDALLPRIMDTVTELIKAERSTFFIADHERGELWSKVVQGGVPSVIRLRIGDGIAGWVAHVNQSVNLADAYDDPRFDRSWDRQSGFRTRALLCVPVVDRDSRVTGVIQCLNKRDSRRFDPEDEELLRCIAGQCAVALESARLYEALLERNRALERAEARLRRANSELEILYELERRISEADDLDALLADVVERACTLLNVAQAAVLLANENGSARVYAHHLGREREPAHELDARRARAVCARAQLPVHRVSDDTGALADLVAPELPNGKAHESFSAPLSDARRTLGVIQLVNRGDADMAPDWLLRVVSLLAGQVARSIVVKRDQQAAQTAGRMALLGQSVGAILHDLRTPMTAVAGYADLMAIEGDAELRRTYVERIERALLHMETMTKEVLAFARGRREILVRKVYMDKFVESVRELLVPETERFGVALVIRADYDDSARFDENKIKRVIFNLARNACQAMDKGGTLTWSVRRSDERLVLECSDTGPGIPKEMAGRLFESFASHGKSEGTGLGLAMAKKIVDAHCGQISCSSQPGQGATFTIELPL